MSKPRLLAVGGVVGPAAFIGAWVGLGLRLTNYSPVNDAISELARTGRSTHSAMTMGFVVFGLAMLSFSAALRLTSTTNAWIAALFNGLLTIGVAAAPLGSADWAHFSFAALAYVSLACLPVVFGNKFGRHISAAIAVALAISVVGPTEVHGLFQRIGLTIGDVWIASTAFGIIRRRP